jgi:hypothetical protein
MQPDHGARLELVLLEGPPETLPGGEPPAAVPSELGAVRWYRCELVTAEQTWAGAVAVAVEGGTVHGLEPALAVGLPAWIVAYARSALRVAWREHQAQGWPRRLSRWRAAPERAQ